MVRAAESRHFLRTHHRAPKGNRTLDLLLTMETLCRLSYRGSASKVTRAVGCSRNRLRQPVARRRLPKRFISWSRAALRVPRSRPCASPDAASLLPSRSPPPCSAPPPAPVVAATTTPPRTPRSPRPPRRGPRRSTRPRRPSRSSSSGPTSWRPATGDTTTLQPSIDSLAALGYQTLPWDPACQSGAEELLAGLTGFADPLGVGVVFATAQDAGTFDTLYDGNTISMTRGHLHLRR